MSTMRCVLIILALALVLPGCRQAPAESSLRARLSPPLVALAGTLERAFDMADSARYRVERGQPMLETLGLLRGTLDAVRSDAAELALAAREVEQPEAAAIARQSVSLALAVADDTDRELAALAVLGEADVVMSRLVDSWHSQPDAQLVAQVQGLAASLAQAAAVPADCPGLRDNRVRWSNLLVQRSAQLEDGSLREAFLANPFAEDRRAADASDRECWRLHGGLPKALADLEPLLRRFDELTAAPA